MKDRDVKLYNRVFDDYRFLKDECKFEVLGVFVFGSQNYKVDTETSDIDTKAVIIPNLEDLISGKSITPTYQRSDGELHVYDIKSFHESLVKQAPNFVECLFTGYRYLDMEYWPYYQDIIKYREEIARGNVSRTYRSLKGTIQNKEKKLFTAMPSNAEKVKRYGYDNKAFSDIMRMQEFIIRYLNNVPYKDCLIPRYPDKIVEWKTTFQFSVEDIKQQVELVEESLKTIEKSFSEVLEVDKFDENLYNMLNRVTKECIAHNLRKKLRE